MSAMSEVRVTFESVPKKVDVRFKDVPVGTYFTSPGCYGNLYLKTDYRGIEDYSTHQNSFCITQNYTTRFRGDVIVKVHDVTIAAKPQN